MMTRRELYMAMSRLAEPIYGEREAAQIARMIAEERLGWSRLDLLLAPDEWCGVEEVEATRILEEISAGRPVQYIIGEAEFCDFRLAVREGVLIPRGESEELVRWIVSRARLSKGRVLEVGIGSGALSIALSRALPHYDVEAIEISKEAIEVASENVERLAPRVKIIEGDALRGVENYTSGEYDVILSNPPYIPQREEREMRINVTEYEPHLALFVPDDDPMLFYRVIATSALGLLNPSGELFFEVHENYATQTRDMLHGLGYVKVEIRNDINDKARMICASLV